MNWGNYDLVVIDESHNFRNGGKLTGDEKENRYMRLLNKVVRAGVKTKVLMLSATPVNNRFNDLKNQLALAYEGNTDYIDTKLNTARSIDDIFRNAQKAFKANKAIQNYVFTDGYALDGQSTERKFVENLDAAQEVCVYAKLPKGFAIPTPVGNYSPDWAIAFNEGAVKHIYFVAETKGTMDTMSLKPIEKAKIDCVKKLFNELSTSKVKYHNVDSYQNLLAVMNTL